MAKITPKMSGKKTKDLTVVPVSKKAKTSANVQKTFPGSSKAPKNGK